MHALVLLPVPTHTQNHLTRLRCNPLRPRYFSVSAQRGKDLGPIDVLKGCMFDSAVMPEALQVCTVALSHLVAFDAQPLSCGCQGVCHASS